MIYLADILDILQENKYIIYTSMEVAIHLNFSAKSSKPDNDTNSYLNTILFDQKI